MYPQENMFVIEPGTEVLKIVQNGVANFLRKRQPGLTPTLTHNANATLRPVDVRQKKVPNIARTQTQSGKEKYDCTVARARCAVWIANRNESLDIVGIDVTWQRCKPPPGDAGDCRDKVR